MSENVQAAQNPDKAGAVSEIVEIVKTIVYALLIALVLRVLFFQPFTIPSASMEPNLYQGDYIIVSKYSYGYSRHSIPFSPPTFVGTTKEDSGYGFIRDVASYRETMPGGKTFLTNDFGTDGELDNTDVFVVPEGHY